MRSARLLFLLALAAVPVPGAPNPPPRGAGFSLDPLADVLPESADADGRPIPRPIGLACRVLGFEDEAADSSVSWIEGDGLAESDGQKKADEPDRVDWDAEAVALADSGREKFGVALVGEIGVVMLCVSERVGQGRDDGVELPDRGRE